MSISDQIELVIPTDPVILKKLADCVDKLKDSKVRQKAETTFQSETIKDAAKETGIPSGFIKGLLAAESEGGVDKMQKEVEDIESLYVAVRNVRKNGVAKVKLDNDAVALNELCNVLGIENQDEPTAVEAQLTSAIEQPKGFRFTGVRHNV